MASTYSGTLNLELQTTGENAATWGTITNNNLQKLESAIKGYVSVAIASTTDSLTATDGTTADETSNAIIKLTGTLTGNTTMQCEAVENWYIVDNAATMGTYTLNFKPAGGTGTTDGLIAGSKHLLYTDGSTMFDVLDDAGNITANGTLDVAGAVNFNGGAFTFNEASANDLDFRIESASYTHAFFVDGSADTIGINQSSPSFTLDIVGSLKATGNVEFDGGSFIFNNASADLDYRIESNGDANNFVSDGGTDRVGIGVLAPAAKLEINQNSASGAVPCLLLDQDDEDKPFIKFDGTSASDQSTNVTTDTSVGSLTGHVLVDVGGTSYWMPFYATN